MQPIFAIKVGANGDISLKDGKETNEYVAWSKQRGGTYMPTPVVYGDYLYTLANQGVLRRAMTRRAGERYRSVSERRAVRYSASPIAADGKLYLASEDGQVLVVKAGPEYELLATNEMGEGYDGHSSDLRWSRNYSRTAFSLCNRRTPAHTMNEDSRA